ncbi:MAG: carbohydrate binding family 9 domain-containing protein [Acidobacteria bacterium]|nr:carbohydrate binding family 9 domain-containing protein [Acidobacteriota bacterium]
MLISRTLFGQDAAPPVLRAGSGADTIDVDGVLNEPAWAAADMADGFAQTEPGDGAAPTFRTEVRVLAGRDALVIGIVCNDNDPAGIVSFTVARDAGLQAEDHIRIVVGPFRDGRSGYVFAVNPRGARYDSLITSGGDSESVEWDGIWEAETSIGERGWSAEIRIPIRTLTFKPGLREWHFNVERRVQRLLETDRWASATRQFRLRQTGRAGLLTGLPDFALGRGLDIRPSVTGGGGTPAPAAALDGTFRPSLDVTQRIGSNVTASLTLNTDFAETEVDTRQTNLTRFPLFFPEKRTFFLEGSDLYQFGPTVNRDVIPYFSRRIGLVAGRDVPLVAGAKIDGRVGGTNFGGLVIGANDRPGIVEKRATMAVARVRQNIWRESYVGALVTTGDPLGRGGSWLAGLDFTYQTTRFLGDKNLTASLWGLATRRDELRGDTAAYAFKIDYPNDEWDWRVWYKRVGRDFDPSLGFVPRRAVQIWNPSFMHRPRFAHGPIQQMSYGVNPYLWTDLSGQWETYDAQIHVLDWLFRSGDRVRVFVSPSGDRPRAPFAIAPDVVIPPGPYEWLRRSIGVTTAQKRRYSMSLNWISGSFYNGELDQYEWSWVWNPAPLFTVEFNGERNIGRMPEGRFRQHLVGTRVRMNFSPDLSVSSYAQYDTDTDSVGVNTRLRWTFLPVADLFVVYNHNVRSLLDRWEFESNQLLVKLQYTWRR